VLFRKVVLDKKKKNPILKSMWTFWEEKKKKKTQRNHTEPLFPAEGALEWGLW
jgi:hypothetical protein